MCDASIRIYLASKIWFGCYPFNLVNYICPALDCPRVCMQDTFARATHSAGRPSAARDDRVSCIQPTGRHRVSQLSILVLLPLYARYLCALVLKGMLSLSQACAKIGFFLYNC